MQFTYTPFGKLVEVQVIGNYYNIINEDGDSVSINHFKYRRSPEFLTKLQELVGHKVVYRSSVGNFSDGVYSDKNWFTDVFLDDGLSAGWPKDGDPDVVESLMDARLALRRARQKAEADAAELEAIKTQLDFEKHIEGMGYTQFRKLLNTDINFGAAYGTYVKWKNERGRTPLERETYPQDKKDYDSQPPLIEQGFQWRVLGTLQSFVEDDNGTIKVVTSEDTIYFAFPKHVYYRQLIAGKLDMMVRQPVWALINDEDHTKDIRFIDITIHDVDDESFLTPYHSLVQIELQTELADKLRARAERLSHLDEVVADQAMQIEMSKPTDEELVEFYNEEVRPLEVANNLTYSSKSNYHETKSKEDSGYKRLWQGYLERSQELKDNNEETIFIRSIPIDNPDTLRWIELPKGIKVEEKNNEPVSRITEAMGILVSTPVQRPKVTPKVELYYEKGDVRRWSFDYGITHPKAREGSRMSYKARLLKDLPIYLLVNDKNEFIDITVNDGRLENESLPTYKGYEERETRGDIERLIRAMASDQNQQLADLQDMYEESEKYIAGLPENRRSQQQEWADMVSDRIDEFVKAGRRTYRVIGMNLSERKHKDKASHTDATLAVKCGIDMSKTSHLLMAVHDQHYKGGKPHRNMVEATVYRNATDDVGIHMTVGLGVSDQAGTYNEIFIPTAWDSGDKRLINNLKKLGYKSEHRNGWQYPLSYFLDLHKRAMEMIRQEDREKLSQK